MELSINAIIMIIIAIMVIGIGLGVVNGGLSLGFTKLAHAADTYKIEIPATRDNLLVVNDPLYLKASKPTIIHTSFFNDGHPSCDDDLHSQGAWLTISCPDQDISFESLQTVPLDVPTGQAKNLALSATIDGGAVSSTSYLCFIDVYCSDYSSLEQVEEDIVFSKSLFLKVRS